MTNAAAYLRVSTAGQLGEDRFGLEEQRDAVETFARAQDFEIVKWYADEGVSGAILDRPALQELLQDAEGDGFEAVLVAKMDRVARDLYVQLFVEKELLVRGTEIVSVTEPVAGSDPMSRAFRQMMGVFAELEKSVIALRMAGGRRQKAKQGGYAGGSPAIGYTATRGGKVLELDAEKAQTVRRVFEIEDSHPEWTLQEIAAALNEEGHTTAQGKTFHPMQVKRVLDRREFYAGQYKYAGIEAEGKHAAIL